MKKLLATASALAAIALTSSPAEAASQATGTARIYRPLVLTSSQNLNLGIIVLSGASFSGESVTINGSGTITTCGTTAGDLTCSGSTTAAIYNVAGANNQTVTISAPAFNLVNGATNLLFTPSAPATVLLTNSGAPGTNFNIGGTLSGLSNTTPDGTYTGTFNVTVAYQ